MLREKDKLLCLQIQKEIGREKPSPIYKYIKEDGRQIPVYMTDKEEIIAFLLRRMNLATQTHKHLAS